MAIRAYVTIEVDLAPLTIRTYGMKWTSYPWPYVRMERSGFSILGHKCVCNDGSRLSTLAHTCVWNEVDLVPLVIRAYVTMEVDLVPLVIRVYGTKWTSYHWLAKKYSSPML